MDNTLLADLTEAPRLSADAIRYLDYLRQIEWCSLAADMVFTDFLIMCDDTNCVFGVVSASEAKS